MWINKMSQKNKSLDLIQRNEPRLKPETSRFMFLVFCLYYNTCWQNITQESDAVEVTRRQTAERKQNLLCC